MSEREQIEVKIIKFNQINTLNVSGVNSFFVHFVRRLANIISMKLFIIQEA